ncbi:MAG: type I methionyl aminopeptidase [Planctomycetota bacterium]
MIRRRSKYRLTESQQEKMRTACQFNAEVMDFVRPHVIEGATTQSIDELVHQYTLDHGHKPACLGYPGDKYPFPKSCCISVNDVICHGIPGNYVLKSGDIVNVDLTSIVDGWHGDQSETFIIGDVHQEARLVTQCAFESLYLAIDNITSGSPISNIGEAIVNHVATNYAGFGVVDKYIGHGIGQKFHQPPNIPHVPNRNSRQERLYAGMCFTIEPMINGGTSRTVSDPTDGWTVRTADGKVSAQFEHTILMTDDGPEIMTLTQNGPKPGDSFL